MTTAIKASHIKQLEQHQDRRLPGDRFITAEFADHLATLSQTRELYPDVIFISATERLGLENLR